MSFPAYESYRDSRVEWLGEVPARWAVSRLRFVAGINPSKAETGDLDDGTELSFLPMEAIGEDGTLDLSRVRPVGEVRSGYSYFADGDVAFAKVTPCLENGKGALMRGLIGGRGFGTTELTVLRPKDAATARFLWWIVASHNFRGPAEGEMIGAGGLKRVPDDFVADYSVPWPSEDERKAIAAFLDRETAKIDALVSVQQRLVELLKEKRQAVISHAVTKGLDPTVPMKDSGVEWLGEVPAHWECVRLRTVATFFQGKAHEPYFDADGKHVCVTARFISTSGQAAKWCNENLSPASFGDILMVMSDLPNGRALARSYLVEDHRSYAVNQRVCCIRILNGTPAFFAHQLNRNQQLLQLNDGVDQTHLKNGAFTRLVLAVPPRLEQDQIANFLSIELVKIDELSSKAEAAITLLRERRAALISAAVTGKIDVRGLVPAEREAA